VEIEVNFNSNNTRRLKVILYIIFRLLDHKLRSANCLFLENIERCPITCMRCHFCLLCFEVDFVLNKLMATCMPWVEWFLLGSEFHQVYGELILPLCYIQLFLVYVCVIQMCPFDLLGCVNQCKHEEF